MKNLVKSLVIAFLFVGGLFAQNTSIQAYNDTYIPSTNYAGTLMSARSLSTSYSDTTRTIKTRGYAAVYIGLETAANDSGRVLVAYSPSKDGVNYDDYVLLDSLVTSGTVGKLKYIALPANALGAYSVKVRLYGNSDVPTYSANPSTTLTTKIIRIPYNLDKIR